jgi:multiple sugar transport system permease protein
MYWLAALQTVPQDVYDAAKIDGAQGFKLWFHIILPIVLPFAIVIVLVEAVGALNVFPLIETMTAGGPFFSSEVMEVYIFRTAFVTDSGTMPRLGYACAAGVFWGVAVLCITVLQGIWIRKTRRL